MTPTKYDELCVAVLQSKTARESLQNLFTEKFADYMGCQDYCVSIDISESATTLNPITYNAELSLKVESDLGDRVIHVKEPVIFKHHPEKAPNHQFQASYKGVLVNLSQNAEPMFNAIFTELQRTII